MHILGKNFFIWAVMTIIPSALLNPFDMEGFLTMSKLLGLMFGIPLAAQTVYAWRGRSASGADDEWTSEAISSSHPGPTMNPGTGSMMMNDHVDMEGRGYGQGYDD